MAEAGTLHDAFIEELREWFPGLPLFAISGSSRAPFGVKILRKPVSSEWRTEIDRAIHDSGFMTA